MNAMLFCLIYITKMATQDEFTLPNVASELLQIEKKFTKYDVILRPDRNEPEWWAGAPSVVRDDKGIFWLACRMRTAEGQRGFRGYEIRILKSQDGVHYEKVKSILREQVPVPGFERPAIVIDPVSQKFKLYVCAPNNDGIWSILKFDDAETPEKFLPETAKQVISPPDKRFERDIRPHWLYSRK